MQQREEKEMEGEYEFRQSDLPDTLYPSGEHRETQTRYGVYEKFHTKVYLGGDVDEDTQHIINTTGFNKVGAQARCMWCSHLHKKDH